MDTLARIRLLTADDNFWEQQNPVLLKGEVGFRNVESDDPLMRVGDGLRDWNHLPDMNKVGPQGPIGEIGPVGPPGPEGPRGPPGQEHDPWTAPFTVNDPGGTLLFRLNANRNIEFGGCMTLTPTGCAIGLNILGGATTTLQAAGFTNVGPRFEVMGPGSPPVAIRADGTGRIGVNPNTTSQLDWNAAGKWTLYSAGAATWATSYVIDSLFEIWGDAGKAALSCQYRGGAVNKFAAYIVNETPAGAGAGACNGLRIEAGWVRQDDSFRVTSTQEQSGPGTNTHINLFKVCGDGLLIARLPTRSGMSTQLTWDPTDSGIYRIASSRRYKANIQSVARERAREIVRRLRAVSYTSACPDDDPTRLNFGLIAEEVAAIEPALAVFDKDGRPESLQYDRVLLMLLPLVQEILGMNEPEEVYG